MPNRIIKDSLLDSDKIASLSDFEFRLWIGLILVVDDAGRGDARPAIIKGRVFPLRERVSLRDINDALHGLAAKGCVSLYNVGGKPYFWFPTWDKHQRIRNVRQKYPSPENSDFSSMQQSAASCGGLRPESNPNTNPIQSIEAYASCAAPETDATPPAIALPLNDGTEFPVSAGQIREWSALYPAVDVEQQLRNMLGWLSSKPERRKTRRGIRSFVTNWLAKEQNRGGSVASTSARPYARGVPYGSAGQGPLGELERRALERLRMEDDP